MRILGIIIGFTVLLMACGSEEKQSSDTVLGEDYESLIQELNNSNIKLTKYLSKEGLTDTVMVDSVDWKKELSLFLASDIKEKNKSDYDRLEFKDDCKHGFISNSKKTALRELVYSNCDGLKLKAELNKSSKLYDFNYYLELNTKGFLIEAKQDVQFAYDSDLRIEGKFRK